MNITLEFGTETADKVKNFDLFCDSLERESYCIDTNFLAFDEWDYEILK